MYEMGINKHTYVWIAAKVVVSQNDMLSPEHPTRKIPH